MIGTRLGHYDITRHLGSGGMGEVYEASDSKLGRQVALKLLPEAFRHDADRLARFQREARVLAALNHPNIASIYGIEEGDGKAFLVMELVPGDTLAERIARGPLPVDESLGLAVQIADAFASAHEKGIIHRDLKPANVKITPEGKIKVLDFGLAKAFSDARQASDFSNSPTISLAATQAGLILGTAGYMSPEQAKGAEADRRSDIFAFGAVLYEMISGRRAFLGETVSDVLASVLAREPDFSALLATLHPRLMELLRRCVDKDPRKRWQDIGDVRLELEAIADAPHVEPREATPRRPLWKRALPIAVTAVVFSIAALAIGMYWRPAASQPVVRFSWVLPEDQRIRGDSGHVMSLSPDGTRLAYTASGKLFVRNMSETDARLLVDRTTSGGAAAPDIGDPFFSPDGQWVGFYSRSEGLKKVAVTGGASVLLCKTTRIAGAAWIGNEIVFAQQKGISSVSENGGEPRDLISITDPSKVYRSPQLLDGGQSIVYSISGVGDDLSNGAQIVAQRLPTGEPKVLALGGTDVRMLPTGHLVYSLEGTVYAIPFDEKALEVHGGPIPLIEGVAQSGSGITRAAHFAISESGMLAYVRDNGLGNVNLRTLAWLDRAGKLTPLSALPPDPYWLPRISPVGKQLAVVIQDGQNAGIWIYALEGDRIQVPGRRLTFGGRNANSNPVWSPDGRWIAYTAVENSTLTLVRQLADGSTPPELLLKAPPGIVSTNVLAPMSWSQDGKTLLLNYPDPSNTISTYMLQLEGLKLSPLVDSAKPQLDNVAAAFSPNARWFTYATDTLDEGRRTRVLVQPFPAARTQYQVSDPGALAPLWSPDGHQLFYQINGKGIAIVDVETGTGFTTGKTAIIPVPGMNSFFPNRTFDVTPDGKRFIVTLSRTPDAAPPPREEVNFVLNWFEELRQRVPAK